MKIRFGPTGEKLNLFLDYIKKFGEVYYNQYSFKECPINISEKRKYILTGENKNILTKLGEAGWNGVICESELNKSIEEHKWKIKIIKTCDKSIMVGVAHFDFDIRSSNYYTCGWFLCCYYSPPMLYSGPPNNYNNVKTKLSQVKDEVVVVMNMKKRTLKFIINNEDKGESFVDLPIDKPLFPAV